MDNFFKRTWAEINLDAIRHNYTEIKQSLNPDTKICCVVKADGYGHGASFVAKELERIGAEWFAVSNLEEAIQLRRSGVEGNMLILGYTPPQEAARLHEMNISQTVFSYEYGKELAEHAVAAGVQVKIHIKVDTGMSRIGFLYQVPERDAAVIDRSCPFVQQFFPTSCRLCTSASLANCSESSCFPKIEAISESVSLST